jgi:coenzyme F420-reducing hydrogenase gamma subunit
METGEKFGMTLMMLAIGVLMLMICTGCTALNNVTEGIKSKSISGSGTFMYSTVGLDKQTQTPELTSLFVWGDYTSVCAGDEIFRLEETEDSSLFNAEATTKKRKVFFASGDKARMDKVIDAFSKTK